VTSHRYGIILQNLKGKSAGNFKDKAMGDILLHQSSISPFVVSVDMLLLFGQSPRHWILEGF